MPTTTTDNKFATHIDSWNMPMAFSEGDWPFYPTPCCGAPVSIFSDDGSVYCKACYGPADPSLCGHPVEPYRPIKEA